MRLDKYEEGVRAAFESGALIPIATKEELERIRESARATATQDQRINIRLSAGDLRDIQVTVMQEGMPYQTLIASVLHKYVTAPLHKSFASEYLPKGNDLSLFNQGEFDGIAVGLNASHALRTTGTPCWRCSRSPRQAALNQRRQFIDPVLHFGLETAPHLAINTQSGAAVW